MLDERFRSVLVDNTKGVSTPTRTISFYFSKTELYPFVITFRAKLIYRNKHVIDCYGLESSVDNCSVDLWASLFIDSKPN